MASELRKTHNATGATNICAVLENLITGQFWNTSGTPAWEAMTVANVPNYRIALTETAAGSYFYVANLPAGIVTAADIFVRFYDDAALVSADLNNYTDHDTIPWSGTARISVGQLQPMLVTIDETADAILVDTIEIGPEGNGLVSIPWNPAWETDGGATAQQVWEYAIRTLTSAGGAVVQQPGWYGGSITIRAGDSYNTTVGQTITIPKSDISGAVWPVNLTGWTITFTATKKASNTAAGTATLTTAGTVVTATGASQAVRIDLTVLQTDALATGPAMGWVFDVQAVSGLNSVTLVSGNMTVLDEQTE